MSQFSCNRKALTTAFAAAAGLSVFATGATLAVMATPALGAIAFSSTLAGGVLGGLIFDALRAR